MRSASGCDRKKALSPVGKREIIQYLMETHKLSKSRSCRIAGLSRTARNRPRVDWLERDREVIGALKRLLASFPRSGFRKYCDLLRRQGFTWNKKRIYRVYRAMGLNLPRPTKRRLPSRDPSPLSVPDRPNKVWSADFVTDALHHGTCIRLLNIIDHCTREVLVIEVDTSLRSARLVRVFEMLRATRGLPEVLRVDNGPEFLGRVFTDWCRANNVRIEYIQPGKPTQNAFIERFNRSLRREGLAVNKKRTYRLDREMTLLAFTSASASMHLSPIHGDGSSVEAKGAQKAPSPQVGDGHPGGSQPPLVDGLPASAVLRQVPQDT